jgi:hypothetical protein
VAAIDSGFNSTGFIYASTNSGANWTLTAAPGYEWWGIASSADGTILTAVVNSFGNSPVYISTNSGVTWARTIAPTNQSWTFVASSADGTKLVGQCAGTIYISTNTGGTWAPCSLAQNGPVACSADGTKLMVAAYNGGIWTSADTGSTWTLTSAPANTWTSIASSADGTRLVAGTQNSWLYTSTNSGSTWTISGPIAYWSSVASSADGKKLVAAVNGGGVYVWESSPLLTSASSGGTLRLSWPSFWKGTGLQQNSDLSATNWGNVPMSPVVTNGMNQVTVAPTNAIEFYRLKYP